ncbi:MAG: RNA polymerase-associated protein RapA [Xanthomonadales bacterium]|nr:RNA polymerase-associated protein RapA [Xanthomonadales bacterium]MCE7930605.1 RNA polymerase-associated protein RapA [Xanthomonadales bacterium PRO6]
MSFRLVPGQRWYSTAEPELGLGTIKKVDQRSLELLFTKAGMLRRYALTSAPLSRAEFRVGDQISADGALRLVDEVEDRDGLMHYRCEGLWIAEAQLDDVQAASAADERLTAGRVDTNARFVLRCEALARRAQARSAPSWGIASARVSLLPHQLAVVEAALAQAQPRVLLADEVGLGKTIEAGLIAARMIATGRAQRVLVLVPEALVYQWFVELLRRFNLRFSIYDAERADSIEQSDEARNPFQDDQFILTDLGFLTGNAKRARQVVAAGWDLMVVDEAHHLAWTPEETSAEYALVEQLALQTPSVVLLTATPEQLGRSGHFARLRLLDPARYNDLAHFEREAQGYQSISRLAEALLADGEIAAATLAQLAEVLHDEPELLPWLTPDASADVRQRLLGALIDRHGTGRVMFRNRRASVGGFPRRVVHLDTLHLPHEDQQAYLAALREEFECDVGLRAPPTPLTLQPVAEGEAAEAVPPAVLAMTRDPRLLWLVQLIDRLAPAKLLLICRTRAKVELLEAALRLKSGARVARFHEGLTLTQRDRNAAYFAQEDGARVLLCSEIGSEGRNFQFAQHLVLWDLPADPDLLEQRIGRLDRIGQRADVELHHAVLPGSAQQALARWYIEALDALSTSPADGRELYKRFGPQVVALALRHADGEDRAGVPLAELIECTRTAHRALSEAIMQGRDRLLELATRFGERGAALRGALAAGDARREDDDFVLKLLEQFGIQTEELGGRNHRLDPEYLSSEDFPWPADGAITVTFDREVALAREELPLLRLDQPMVQGAVELLIGGETGNAAFLIDPTLPPRSAWISCVFLLECVADRRLDVERYLPPQPITVTVDSRLVPRDYNPQPQAIARADDKPVDLAKFRPILSALVPPMKKAAEERAKTNAQSLIAAALQALESGLGAEFERLKALQHINPGIRESEVEALCYHLESLRAALPEARVRLDAIRLAVSPDFMRLVPA